MGAGCSLCSRDAYTKSPKLAAQWWVDRAQETVAKFYPNPECNLRGPYRDYVAPKKEVDDNPYSTRRKGPDVHA